MITLTKDYVYAREVVYHKPCADKRHKGRVLHKAYFMNSTTNLSGFFCDDCRLRVDISSYNQIKFILEAL